MPRLPKFDSSHPNVLDLSPYALDCAFTHLSRTLHGTQALLTWQEAAALYILAGTVPGDGVAVELGSHLGGSTVALGQGCKERGFCLVAVEKWTGRPAGEVHWTTEAPTAGEKWADLYPMFYRNIRDRGLDSTVTAIRGMTTEVAAQWVNPIRLLFIDADHTYEGVKADWVAWSPFVSRGGVVAFHDYGMEPGVTQLVDTILADDNSGWKALGLVDSIFIMQRSSASPRDPGGVVEEA